MKADLKFKAVWWNSFLFYWALIFLLFALVAAAADFFNLGRLMLWAALGAFAGAKTVRLLEVCFLMKETDKTRVFFCTDGERVRVENGYGRRTGIMKAGEG